MSLDFPLLSHLKKVYGGGGKWVMKAMVVSFVDVVFDGALRALGEEEVVVGEGVVVTSSSLEMLTNNYLGGMIVNLIFFEGFKEEALVEFMVELVEEDGDDK
ncbi:hypothetical protein Tco_0061484 [Tanacetum coccineum]